MCKKSKVVEIISGVMITLVGGFIFFNGGTIIYLVLGIILTLVLVYLDKIKAYLLRN